MLDFKITEIREYDNGEKEATLRIFRGEISTEEERVVDEEGNFVVKPITRFRCGALVRTIAVQGKALPAMRAKIIAEVRKDLKNTETLEEKVK